VVARTSRDPTASWSAAPDALISEQAPDHRHHVKARLSLRSPVRDSRWRTTSHWRPPAVRDWYGPPAS